MRWGFFLPSQQAASYWNTAQPMFRQIAPWKISISTSESECPSHTSRLIKRADDNSSLFSSFFSLINAYFSRNSKFFFQLFSTKQQADFNASERHRHKQKWKVFEIMFFLFDEHELGKSELWMTVCLGILSTRSLLLSWGADFWKFRQSKAKRKIELSSKFFVGLVFFTWWVRPHSRLASSRWWWLDGRFRPKARQRRSRRSPSALFAFSIKWSSPPFFVFKFDLNFKKFIFRKTKFEIKNWPRGSKALSKFSVVDLKKGLPTNHSNWAYFIARIIRNCRAKSRIRWILWNFMFLITLLHNKLLYQLRWRSAK